MTQKMMEALETAGTRTGRAPQPDEITTIIYSQAGQNLYVLTTDWAAAPPHGSSLELRGAQSGRGDLPNIDCETLLSGWWRWTNIRSHLIFLPQRCSTGQPSRIVPGCRHLC